MSRVPLFIDPAAGESATGEYRVLSDEFSADGLTDELVGVLKYNFKTGMCKFKPETNWSEQNLFPPSEWEGNAESIVAARNSEQSGFYSRRLFLWMKFVVESHAVNG